MPIQIPNRRTLVSGMALVLFGVLAFSAYFFPAGQLGGGDESTVSVGPPVTHSSHPLRPTHKSNIGELDLAREEAAAAKPLSTTTVGTSTTTTSHIIGGSGASSAHYDGFQCSDPTAGSDRSVGAVKLAKKWQGTSPGNATNATASTEDIRECCWTIDMDIDKGLTLFHYMTRMWCTQFLYDQQKLHRLSAAANDGDDAEKVTTKGEGFPTSTIAGGSPPKVLQIGANTGDNANDHLVKFLKMDMADAVLLEPVPWVFDLLSKTYKDYRGHVKLYNAAVSTQRGGNVTFEAPKKEAKGWVPQMGGLTIPEKSKKLIAKKGLGRFFETIQVPSYTIESLMDSVGWSEMPDVAVVDTEGFDAEVVRMLLAETHRRQQVAGDSGGPTIRPIRIIQYEWKHLRAGVRAQLQVELADLGYCVGQVHYDDVAIHQEWGRALDMRASDKARRKVPLESCSSVQKLTRKKN